MYYWASRPGSDSSIIICFEISKILKGSKETKKDNKNQILEYLLILSSEKI